MMFDVKVGGDGGTGRGNNENELTKKLHGCLLLGNDTTKQFEFVSSQLDEINKIK